jgi:anti-anti-sigma factor
MKDRDAHCAPAMIRILSTALERSEIAVSGDRIHGISGTKASHGLRAFLRMIKSVRLVLNVSGVERIDAAGLTVLIKAYRAAKRAGANVTLAHVPRLEMTLRARRLDAVFDHVVKDAPRQCSTGCPRTSEPSRARG